MLENILKEFKRKFRELKILIINNSLTLEETRVEISKFVFALNTIKSSIKKNETAFSAAQISKVNELLLEIEDLRKLVPELFEGIDTENIIVEELKEHLPKRIHSDSMDEEISIEQ